MKRCHTWALPLAGLAAGTVNGLLGAGGGMILVPIMSTLTDLGPGEIFPVSLTVMLPLCLISLLSTGAPLPWADALPYLLGGALGGIGAGIAGGRIPVKWLHRILGAMLLWGGIRSLC